MLTTLYYILVAALTAVFRNPCRLESLSRLLARVRKRLSKHQGKLIEMHVLRFLQDCDRQMMDSVLREYRETSERCIFALFHLRRATPQEALSRVKWQGKDILDDALSEGRGVLMLVPHYGDERSLHILMGMAGYSVDVMTSRYRDMPAYPRKCRLSTGTRWNTLHYPDENPRWMYRVLQNGGLVHYASTSFGGPGGTWIENFGVPVLVPSAPWKLTKRLGCRVLLATCTQKPGMCFTIAFQELALPEGKTAFAREVGRATEDIARQNPGQYTWKNLVIRHRESNAIRRIGYIPRDEGELEALAIPEDSDPCLIRPAAGDSAP